MAGQEWKKLAWCDHNIPSLLVWFTTFGWITRSAAWQRFMWPHRGCAMMVIFGRSKTNSKTAIKWQFNALRIASWLMVNSCGGETGDQYRGTREPSRVSRSPREGNRARTIAGHRRQTDLPRAPSPHGGIDAVNLSRADERGKQRSGHRLGGSSVQRARHPCDCRVIVTSFSGARLITVRL